MQQKGLFILYQKNSDIFTDSHNLKQTFVALKNKPTFVPTYKKNKLKQGIFCGFLALQKQVIKPFKIVF